MKRSTRIRKELRNALGILAGAGIVVLAGITAQGPALVQAQTLPLPALSTRVQPVVHFLLDTSGSMDSCDGGYVDETKDLTVAPSGGYLFDPSVDTSDDGDCNNTRSNRYQEISYRSKNYASSVYLSGAPTDSSKKWKCPTSTAGITDAYARFSASMCAAAGLAGRTMGTRDGLPGTRVFAITRLEAMKLAISKILDVNGDGTIDSFDEQILRVKISFTHFDDTEAHYNTSRTELATVGATYNSVWTTIRTLHAQGITPSGSALLGARHHALQYCWDSNIATPCALGPGQNDPVTGDDLALSCRRYYVVFLTDGEPNGGGSGCSGCSGAASPPVVSSQPLEDPITEAEALLEGVPGYTNDGENVGGTPVDPSAVFPTKRKEIRTIGIGFGSEAAQAAPSRDRVVINCMTYVGAKANPAYATANGTNAVDLAADADGDGDQDVDPVVGPTTMSLNTNGTGESSVTCSGYNDTAAIGHGDFFGDSSSSPYNPSATSAGVNYAAAFHGNGYFATNATQLVETFKRILNAIQAGTFTRSDPTLSSFPGASSLTDEFIYTPTFVVPVKGVDWRGHFEKFKFVAGTGYEDCDTSTPNAVDPTPCWDAGDLLRNRDFRTRTVYLVNPDDYASGKFKYEPDYTLEALTGWTDSDPTANPSSTDAIVGKSYPTVRNGLSSALSPNLGTMNLSTSAVATSGRIFKWALMSNYKTDLSTYKPDGSDAGTPGMAGGITLQALGQAYDALAYAVGRPDSFFVDGTLKCGKASCSATDPTFKLGDSYNSRPVIVGPPVGLVSDPEYVTEFRNRPLTSSATANTAIPGPRNDNSIAYSGGEAPKEPPLFTGPASPCKTGVAAADCTVQDRRVVDYLPANDGSIHAFDDESGEELWAFIPPGHMAKLKNQLNGRSSYIDGLPVIRDVKFPCERNADFTCKSAGGNEPFEDGLWHTVLFMNQGAGGDFLFALDITNPVAPKFLWEYRDPSTLGVTIAPPSAGDIPTDTTGYTTKQYPGSSMFLPGGYFGVSGTSPAFHTLDVWSGRLQDKHTFADSVGQSGTPSDLAPDSTRPGGLVNGMTGAPRAIDADLDGRVDRIYFGDKEGRMWKACDIQKDGTFKVNLFFDPAQYDGAKTMTGPDGVSRTYIGQPATAIDPTSDKGTEANGYKELRGPIYYAADATRNKNGGLNVAFGAGDLTDPLDVPTGYFNFVWNVTDNIQSGLASCDPAMQNSCTGAASVFSPPSIPYDTGVYSQTLPNCPCWVQSTNQSDITTPVGNCLNDVWPDRDEYNRDNPSNPKCSPKWGGDDHKIERSRGDCSCAFSIVSPNGVVPGSAPVSLPGTPSSLLTANVVPLDKLMSSPAQFFNGLLFYSEFSPDPNVCGDQFKSRIYNLDAFACGAPSDPALRDASNNPTVSVEFDKKLVTGVQISPVSGTVFVQTSTPQDSPPDALNAPNLKMGNTVAGWKQSN